MTILQFIDKNDLYLPMLIRSNHRFPHRYTYHVETRKLTRDGDLL